MVLVLMYRGLSASDKHNMRQNIHDYVHVQGAELPRRQRDPNINYHSQTHAKVDIRQKAQWPKPKHQQSKLISARKHTDPSINSTAEFLPKLISARQHSGPSINSQS
jgi:hypothetical protein